MRIPSFLVPLALVASTACCASKQPPASRFPTADDALDRMHATFHCGNAIKAFFAKFDDFAGHQRVRGDVSFFVARPDRIKMDIFAPAPLNTPVAALTTDGDRFSLLDEREHRFFVGPASPCNIARLTKVAVPTHVMVELLTGQAPVLKHERAAASLEWSADGYYVVRVPGANDAHEEIRLVPHPDDFAKPWSEQRVRVLRVKMEQEGFTLYEANLAEHRVPPMDVPLEPQVPGDPSVPLSGPACTAEVPHQVEVKMPLQDENVQFRYTQIWWNPPMEPGKFTQEAPAGMRAERVTCQ